MLRALLERGIVPDLVLGTSIGAINGAMIARGPTLECVDEMAEVWSRVGRDSPFSASFRDRVSAVVGSTGVHAYPVSSLRDLLAEKLPGTFEELQVPMACCAASIEHSREEWFDHGPLIPAVLASCALPGVFPPVQIGEDHYIDGGIVNSIPLDRARKAGATRIFVLQVGRLERPLSTPRRPWEVAQIAFEVARRARFHAALERTRAELDVWVLPTGGTAPDPTAWRNLDFRDTSRVGERLTAAHRASATYLDEATAGRIDPRASSESDPVIA